MGHHDTRKEVGGDGVEGVIREGVSGPLSSPPLHLHSASYLHTLESLSSPSLDSTPVTLPPTSVEGSLFPSSFYLCGHHWLNRHQLNLFVFPLPIKVRHSPKVLCYLEICSHSSFHFLPTSSNLVLIPFNSYNVLCLQKVLVQYMILRSATSFLRWSV